MPDRAVSILLLLWLTPFLTVVAPGHQRGALQLPGSTQSGVPDSIGVAVCGLCSAYGGDEDRPVSSTDPAGNCAICQFNGTLLNPPPFALPDLRPQRLDWPAARDAVALRPAPAPLLRLSGRAPPTPLLSVAA